MKRETIEFASQEEWLGLREADITSTDVSALFACSPYVSKYRLWHQKTGQLDADFTPNERVAWGNRLEGAIAYGVAEDLGLVVEPFKVYARLPDERLGSSFDFKITGLDKRYTGEENEYRDLFRQHGPGLMEVKNVDGLVFRTGWIFEDGEVEAPPHIEFQIQHQMLCTGMPWAVGAPLIAGNTPRPFFRLADDAVHKAILESARKFWASIEAGTPPDPEYDKDADTIVSLLFNDDGETIDLSDNDRFDEVCAAYKAAAADEKAAEGRKQAAKGEILDIMGTAAKAMAGHYKVSAKTRKGSPGQFVTPDMIGKYVGARAGSRFPTVTELKK